MRYLQNLNSNRRKSTTAKSNLFFHNSILSEQTEQRKKWNHCFYAYPILSFRASTAAIFIPSPLILTTWRFDTGGFIARTFSSVLKELASSSLSTHHCLSFLLRLFLPVISSSQRWGYLRSRTKLIREVKPFALARLPTSEKKCA